MLWVSESLCIIIIIVYYVKGLSSCALAYILVLLRVSDIQFLERGNKDLYTYMYRLHKSIQNAKKGSFTAMILSG